MSTIESLFPRLVNGDYSITSARTYLYNCIAWAAGENDRWWWPDSEGYSYWPEGVPREETLAAFVAAFTTLGYVICDHKDNDSHVSKIAIFSRSGTPTHVCRQLPNGRWTSKLGQIEDIEHALDDLEGDEYGKVALFLSRNN